MLYVIIDITVMLCLSYKKNFIMAGWQRNNKIEYFNYSVSMMCEQQNI